MRVQEKTPLAWPAGRERAKYRKSAAFGRHTNAASIDFVVAELDRLRAVNVVITANGFIRGEPADPAAAVYFELGQSRKVLACDRWDRLAHNFWAIGLHIESIRGQGRWGVGSMEQAFAGYTAIPERTGGRKGWWEVLGITETATEAQVRAAYGCLAKMRHPDRGGSHEAMVELNQALEDWEQFSGRKA